VPDVPDVPLTPLIPEVPLVPDEPELPDVPEVPPVIVTVIAPPPSSVTDAPLNVIPVTLLTLVTPSPTVSGLPPPVVNPVISTESPKEFVNVNSPKSGSYVPPVIGAVNPVIVIVPPVLLYKSNADVPE
jgi:hypothetical protein